jgi:hypothetical protein
MQLVVSHITRMEAPRICVAGFDPLTLAHIRPTSPPGDPLTRRLLGAEGGPFRMGALVDIGAITPDPSPPETEDHLFKANGARHMRDLDDDVFLDQLTAMRTADLGSAFGHELERIGRTYAVEPGQGGSSLAVLRAERRPLLKVMYGKLRLHYNDAEPPASLPVNDVRFFEADHATIKTSAVDSVSRRLRRGVDAFLMLGLTRAWSKPGETHERHWLQLNGLCLADRAVGDVP